MGLYIGIIIGLTIVLTIVFAICEKIICREMVACAILLSMALTTVFSFFSFCFLDTEKTEITSTKHELISLNDQSEITGSVSGTIFCIRGSLNEKMVYRYYYKKADGGMKIATVDANKTTIYYLVEDEIPYLEIVTNKQSRYNFIGEEVADSTDVSYNFYVPTGSVKEDISLDAA